MTSKLINPDGSLTAEGEELASFVLTITRTPDVRIDGDRILNKVKRQKIVRSKYYKSLEGGEGEVKSLLENGWIVKFATPHVMPDSVVSVIEYILEKEEDVL